MKKLFTLIYLSLILVTLYAQTPSAFKYQAVVRDNSGQIIVNKTVAIRISILSNSATGNAAYSEKHTITTNAFGLVNLEIGNGSILSGSFATINWGIDKYFVKIELDATNSGTFSEMGTSQLLSVPYALYAANAGNGFSGSWNDLANKPSLFSGSYNDLTNKPTLAKIATSGSFTDLLNVPILVTLQENPKVGDVLYHNGSGWQSLAKGNNGQTLRLDNGLPKWGEPGYVLPIVTTLPANDIMTTSAVSGGTVISPGYTEITAKGVCWATTQNPTTANDKTSNGSGIGSFTSSLTNLLSNTTYYLRAYATNGAGTAYGNQISIKTFQNVVFPTVTTTAITNITANAVTSGGNITATGGGDVTARGVCWSDHQNPTISDSKTSDGSGTGQFQSQISGLVPGTYYARAYATNSAGTGYGNMVTFTTEKTLPVLTTKAISEISAMGAVSGGNITSAGGGTISGRGICWSESPNPTIANEKTVSPATASSFSAAIAKATPGTTYYLKAYATNEIGTGYGEQKTFTTSDAQYYTSFETGMTPANWSGPFTVTTETAFEGSYSFKSLHGQDCDATFSITIPIGGQVSFYYSFKDYAIGIDLFIDDIKISNFPNDGSGWRQGLASIDSGNHKIRWHYIDNPGNVPFSGSAANGIGYIDQIIITK